MMMNHFAIHQRDLSAVREEMITKETVVCPKPIRAGVLHSVGADLVKTPRWNLSHRNEVSDSAAATDLLDILLKGGSQDLEPFCTHVDLPPIFSGSPPSRVSNPLIRDSRFKEEKNASQIVSQLQFPITGPSSPSSYARKGGYTSTNFSNNPVVRIQGFACMNRDGQNSAVSARA